MWAAIFTRHDGVISQESAFPVTSPPYRWRVLHNCVPNRVGTTLDAPAAGVSSTGGTTGVAIIVAHRFVTVPRRLSSPDPRHTRVSSSTLCAFVVWLRPAHRVSAFQHPIMFTMKARHLNLQHTCNTPAIQTIATLSIVCLTRLQVSWPHK